MPVTIANKLKFPTYNFCDTHIDGWTVMSGEVVIAGTYKIHPWTKDKCNLYLRTLIEYGQYKSLPYPYRRFAEWVWNVDWSVTKFLLRQIVPKPPRYPYNKSVLVTNIFVSGADENITFRDSP